MTDNQTGPAAPVGGAATTNGIWFQALWVVLQVLKATVASCTVDGNADTTGVTFVLEPLGGDVNLTRDGTRRVVQLKTLNNGTWSLKDVVEKVLPDLYRAVDPDDYTVSYEFVAEGERGRWGEVLGFFQSLAGRYADGNFELAYAGLSNTKILRFAGSQGDFWATTGVSERAVFDRIVEYLRTLAPANDELIELTRRKVWHLLSRFHFDGGHSPESVRLGIEAALLTVAEHRERVPELCNAMAGWIANRSRQNNAIVRPADLFAAHQLGDVLSVCNRIEMQRRCQDEVQGRLALVGYRREWDVRRNVKPEGVVAPFTIVTGGSGEGKSWGVFGAAEIADTMATVLFDSTGDAVTDLQRAADAVWRTALGHDQSLSLLNIARRLADVLGPSRGDPWLTVCIDRVADVNVANTLLAEPVEQWGVRFVLACEPNVAAIFRQHAKMHLRRVEMQGVSRFTLSELHRYLRIRLGEGWVDVPPGIQDLLRKPQLADMYCELVSDRRSVNDDPRHVWEPQDEYELVDAFWSRVTELHNPGHYQDELRLRRLAATLLDGGNYPWSTDQTNAADVDDEACARLIRLGWLRWATAPSTLEMPHDRLLGYAAARSLVARCREGRLDAVGVVDLLLAIENGPHARRLGYLMMDWFHLATRDEAVRPLTAQVLNTLCGRGDHQTREMLCRELLPTLGGRALSLLREQLVAFAEVGQSWELDPVLDGLATWPAAELRETILGFLNDVRPLVRRAGLRLLARRPVSEALDVAWQLHCQMQADPTTYAGGGTGAAASEWRLYEESFDALRAAVRLSPDWLPRAIRAAGPAPEPVYDLAYLVGGLDDNGVTWRACKADLFQKIPHQKRRSLAMNIGIWRDEEESARLEEWAQTDEDDLLAPAAVQAMTQIDPLRGAALLCRLSDSNLYLCRSWFLPRLFLQAGNAAQAVIFERIQASADPLKAALVYQGNVNEMDLRTLDLLLDRLDESLMCVLDNRQATDLKSALFLPLSLLAEVGRSDLLEAFGRRAGSTLEARLTLFLIDIIGPRMGLSRDGLSREPALAILLKIGGDGFGQVTRAYLAAPSQFGRLDAVECAVQLADRRTLEQLAVAGADEARWDAQGTPLVQMEAARALASHGDVAGLLRVANFLGLKIPANLHAFMAPEINPPTEILDQAMDAIRRRDPECLHGSLIVLGVLRHTPVVIEALAILRESDECDARIAAIVTLGYSRSDQAGIVEAIIPYLSDNHCRYAAVQALGRIGGDRALPALLDSLRDVWDTRLAYWLAHQTGACSQAIELLAARMETALSTASSEDLMLLGGVSDDVLADLFGRCNSRVHDKLREAALGVEGGLWFVGSKHNAIRGLSFIDPYVACLAAEKTLCDPANNDRPMYPPLLYGLDPLRARVTFLRLANDEEDEAVIWSMAYSLQASDTQWLLAAHASPLTGDRLAACRLSAGPCGVWSDVTRALRQAVESGSRRIAKAAEASLQHIRAQAQADELAVMLSDGAKEGRAAALVDATLQVGICGYEWAPQPPWIMAVTESISLCRQPGLLQDFVKRVKAKRKKASADSKSRGGRRR